MTSNPTKQAWAMGGVVFAATAMMVAGCFQIIMGIAAIAEDDIFVVGADYTYDIDTTAWGWIHLILGVLVVIAGVFTFTMATWARSVGIAFAAFAAIDNFFFLPYYPLWSIMIIGLSIFAMWALATAKVPGEPSMTAQATAQATGARPQQDDWTHMNAPTASRGDEQATRPATEQHTAPPTTPTT